MTSDNDAQKRLRIDKWLWAARFYKTRGLAQTAVAGGKVKLNGERVKPAKEISAGDELVIRSGELVWAVTVVTLSAIRGPAAVARLLYAESEQSAARRTAQLNDLRAQAGVRGDRKGRPTKRERRELERWRNG